MPNADDQLKCFGEACKGCARFFECPEHWGVLDSSDEHQDDWSTK